MPTNKTAIDALIQDIKTKDPKLHQILSSINRDLNVYKSADEVKYVKSDKKVVTVQEGLTSSDATSSELSSHESNHSAHHEPVTLGINNNPALKLKGQELTLDKALQGGGSGTPTGPAGGDLDGTYPDPVLIDQGAVTPGSYGDSSNTPVITVDQQGRITDVTTAAVAPVAAPAVQIEETSGPTVLDIGAITDGQYLIRSGTGITSATPPGGETNTASNVGTAGTGVVDGKVGADLQFRKLNSLTTQLGVNLDGANQKIDLSLAIGSTAGTLCAGDDGRLGAGTSCAIAVHQVGHGFTVGQALYNTGSVYALAKADAVTTLGLWIVSAVAGNDDFTACQSGYVSGLSGLTAGQYYYVDAITAGALTVTEPPLYSNPILFALTTTTGLVLPFRPSVIGAMPSVPPARNFVQNANFAIWQRGSSQVTIASGTPQIMSDRWWVSHSSDGVVKVDQEAAVLPTVAQSGCKSVYALKLSCTTADASIAAGQFAYAYQNIEGVNAESLIGRTVTFSFWVRSHQAGIYCVLFRNSGNDRSYVVEYTINAVDTWEKKTITLVMHDASAGTWDFTTGVGLCVGFTLACGSTYQTTANAWQTSNYIATSNQVNWLSSNANTFYLSQIKLEIGAAPTDFQALPYDEDLRTCQRYLYVIKSNATQTNIQIGWGSCSATTAGMATIPLPVPARILPTLSLTAADWYMHDGVTNCAISAMALRAAGYRWNTLELLNVDITVAGATAWRYYTIISTGTGKTFMALMEL